ncbi:unnamed protein product, partial [Heterotrigona itama]
IYIYIFFFSLPKRECILVMLSLFLQLLFWQLFEIQNGFQEFRDITGPFGIFAAREELLGMQNTPIGLKKGQ